jgi:hypothetical protein
MPFGYDNAIDEEAQVYYSYGGPDATAEHLLCLAQDILAALSARKLLAQGLYTNANVDVRPPVFPLGAHRRFGWRLLAHGVAVKRYEHRCKGLSVDVKRELAQLENVVRRHFADVRTSAACADWAREYVASVADA